MPHGRRGYVELRSRHHCLMPGHLRAKCPMLIHEPMKQAKITEHQKKEEDQKKEDILLQESADPLPIVHHHGDVRWQGECADVLSNVEIHTQRPNGQVGGRCHGHGLTS